MKNKQIAPAEQLFACASNGDELVLAHLLRAVKINPNIRDQYGVTPLMEACRFGRAACVDLLLEYGADVNAMDKEKASVLMHACSGESSQLIVACLIEQGAQLNRRDVYGCTALMRAAAHGDLAIVQLLVDAGEKLNVESDNQETPLTFAIVWNHPRIVKTLIDAGADVNWEDRSGWTPLHYARHEKKTRIATLLKKHGATLSSTLPPNGRKRQSPKAKKV